MKQKTALFIDALINLILGVILLIYSPKIIDFLGMPPVDHFFYPNILGAVLFGIGLALLVEVFRKNTKGFRGLGFTGAICINISGGIVLFIWLVTGNLQLPLKGLVFLWVLDLILLVISSVELYLQLKDGHE